MLLWLYLAIGVIADTFGIYVSKRFVDSDNWFWIIGLILASIVLSIAYILALKQGFLSVITPIWLVTLTAISVLMGFLIFDEKISPTQWVGIGFALLGITLLQWSK